MATSLFYIQRKVREPFLTDSRSHPITSQATPMAATT